MGPRPGIYAVSVNFLQGMRYHAPDGLGGYAAIGREDYPYFRRFTPVGRAGFSIYIFRISPSEADRVRREIGLPALTPREDHGPVLGDDPGNLRDRRGK